MIDRLPCTESLAAELFKALKLDGFFPSLDADQVEKLFPRSGLFTYPKETAIIKQDTEAKALFFIHEGCVQVLRWEGLQSEKVATLKKGELFGEIGLVKGGKRTASVIAAEDSLVYRLAREDMDYLLKNNKALGQHLTQLAAARLSSK